MYKLLLIAKYLRRKLAPLFAAMAVMLCTMMVIIVVSVMGGFLDLMKTSAQKLTGDVTIAADYFGFPHYEELLAELAALPEIAHATAVIRAPGMVKFEDPDYGDRIHLVEIIGIRPYELDPIIGYADTLYWTAEHLRDRYGPDARVVDLRELGMTLRPPPQWEVEPDTPGMVPGIEVSPWNSRDEQGRYRLLNSSLRQKAVVSVVPITAGGMATEPRSQAFVVVNEFKSGLWEIDNKQVYVPFEVLQRMLRMDAAEAVDDEGMPTGRRIPARTSEIMVRGAAGFTLDQVHDAVRLTTRDFSARHASEQMPFLGTATWMQRHEVLLSAVQNEKGLITFLFAIIGLVSVVMVATTFYMIVLEKTRDIGILRALGASRGGIAGVFLGYGLAIGTVGALLGLAAGVAIVSHLNEIQDLLFHLTLWFNTTFFDHPVGWRMWNPQIYYFDRIPSQVDPVEAGWILAFAIVSSVAGALIPALLASRLDPVETLRYE